MTDHLANVKTAVDNYWSARTAVKQQLRVELEQRLAPERKSIADAVNAAKTAGHPVVEQATYIGITNRNFLYKILNGKPLNPTDAATNPVGRPHVIPESKLVDIPVPDLGWTYRIVDDGVWIDYGDGETYTMIEQDGNVIIPSHWYAAERTPEELQFYRDLIAEIENHG